MATIRKRGTRYQVQVRKKGSGGVSKTFTNLKDAQAWGRKVESEVERGLYIHNTVANEKLTITEAIARYGEDLNLKDSDPSRRLNALKPINAAFGRYYLTALTPNRIIDYRDARLKAVSGSTVNKELSWFSAVINHAVTEWRVQLPRGNPITSVRLPKHNPSRDRRLALGEEQKLLSVLKKTPADLMVLALETAARRGELLSMTWQDIDLKHRVWHIQNTKNGDPRDIPLSTRALGIIKECPLTPGPLFKIHPDHLSGEFHKGTLACGIKDLRFHDLRHEAASRLFEKGLNHMEVATITGHKDLKMLMRYTHLRASDLVHKIG